MRLLLCFIFITIVSCNTSKQATMTSTNTSSAMENGWITLFDGKTTNGWHSYGKNYLGKAWKVEDGSLHLSSESKKTEKAEGGDATTNEEFENFHLKLE